MSKRIRPWDKARKAPPPKKPATEVPSITVDGITYFSDRFYLNKTIYDADFVVAAAQPCCCGATSPPPLLDLHTLVASLKLKAAILATYTIDPDYLLSAYPAFGKIPTLVLHGKKGYVPGKEEDTKENDDDHSSVDEEALLEEKEDDEMSSIVTQVETPSINNENLHFTEVRATWTHPRDVPYEEDLLNEDGTLKDELIRKRTYMKGVHHPKFMLLFEESGDLVVVVTTKNLTEPRTIDGTWVQRFPASVTPKSCDASTTIADLLLKQTLASQTNQLTPLGFVRKYLGWNSLARLQEIDVSNIQVDLIATVPGEHQGRMSAAEKQALYGRQKVAACLEKRTTGSNPVLQASMLGKDDKLCIQPTSFGAEWHSSNFAEAIRSYLGYDRRSESQMTDNDLFDLTKIIWPTEDFINSICESVEGRSSPKSVATLLTGFLQEKNSGAKDEKENEGNLFLSSETFNRIEKSCLARMHMFQPSFPEQRSTLVPHFKSIFRVSGERKRYNIQKHGFGRAEDYLPWFLLTSACLSRGAQGESIGSLTAREDRVRYANFEMGVLFQSQAKRAPGDRFYCYKPSACCCTEQNRAGGLPKLIHLPVPFSINGHHYLEDDDILEFRETPYFHEIPPGTGHVGNMSLTPLGQELLEKINRRTS